MEKIPLENKIPIPGSAVKIIQGFKEFLIRDDLDMTVIYKDTEAEAIVWCELHGLLHATIYLPDSFSLPNNSVADENNTIKSTASQLTDNQK